MSGGADVVSRVVLAVDDEVDILAALGGYLEASVPGLKVLRAGSGREALEMLRAQRVDLILSDYRMPQMTGLEFFAQAQQVAPKVPRLLMTAYPDMELAIQALNRAHVVAFFTKPLDPERLKRVVAEHLGLTV